MQLNQLSTKMGETQHGVSDYPQEFVYYLAGLLVARMLPKIDEQFLKVRTYTTIS